MHPLTLELPTTEKLQGKDNNNFHTSRFMLQKVLGKGFFPEYCLKTNFFFGCIHILLTATFISEGKSVTPLPVLGEKEKLLEEAADSPVSHSRL